MKRKVANLFTISKNSNGNSNNKLRPPKPINFSLFIKQVILNDLGDRNNTVDKKRYYNC